ncbi:uncharacterized protein CCOS01_14219 [Colletotrichum costaricense]|uniref:Uncharacterized protein n=1 Tax=Colletotrichum costaricense TaxID=1209916 RepID=A0AAI9YJM6_9PEZI|nr:uncharacterized protein CCOS01_14219 [Colletotrichum costaricense]KAK1513277.1 hypothetical protein CCOS01_14219 [Colletotrichum costaricense]
MAHPTHALFSRWAATNTGPNSTSSKLSCCFLPSKAPSSQKSQELRSVRASLYTVHRPTITADLYRRPFRPALP